MLPYAATVLAARTVATELGARATFGKVVAEPGAANAISSAVHAWLDARAPDEETLKEMVSQLTAVAELSGTGHGVSVTSRCESLTPIVEFDRDLRDRVVSALARRGIDAPVLPTGAGHDAGILAAGLPTAMLFVRNPTGVSHSPAEHADARGLRGRRGRAGRRARGTRLSMTQNGPAAARAWHAELAWLPGVGVLPDVLIEAAGDRFTQITPRAAAAARPPGTVRLPGLTMPGFANAHSHAFHRGLRGITQAGRGTFWTWRERMYQVAGALDPDSYLALARAVYAEMALAGISCVGEFHYLHHAPGGTPYADPNAMSRALIDAAAQAGLRITLLDTCYLSGGLDQAGGVDTAGRPAASVRRRQPRRRGRSGSAPWAQTSTACSARAPGSGRRSTRCARFRPSRWPPVVAWSQSCGAPLHVHLSEQVAENYACLAAYRSTPAAVLYDAGVLGPRTSVVHATHLTSADIRLLGGSEVFACVCPTTEADLADGIGPFGELAAAGCRLTVGSDSQAVIDLFEEARRIEMYARLASRERGHFTAEALGTAVTWDGHASLGWPDAGEIAPGSLADLVTVALDTPRLAGAWSASAPADGGRPDLGVLTAVMFAATPADVRNVVIGGRDIVVDGRHVLVDDVPGALASAVRAVLG